MPFLPMIDRGIAQTPMFGDGAPDGWGYALPGYGAGRLLVDASFASGFYAALEIVLACLWAISLLAVVTVVLACRLGPRSRPATART